MWHQPGFEISFKAQWYLVFWDVCVVLELAATLLNIIQLSILVAAQCNNGHSSMRENNFMLYLL